MGFSLRCQCRRDALLSICVAHLWWALIKNLFKICHLLLAVRSWRGEEEALADETDEGKRETRQRSRGRKGKREWKRKSSRCIHQYRNQSMQSAGLLWLAATSLVSNGNGVAALPFIHTHTHKHTWLLFLLDYISSVSPLSHNILRIHVAHT